MSTSYERKNMTSEIYKKFNELAQKFKASDFCKNSACVRDKWQNKVNLWGKEIAKKTNISATNLSILGFIVGMMAVNFLAMNMYFEALICILFNRFCDILDGAVARAQGVTEFGRFIDTALDFIFYGGVIFGFALADENNTEAACFLLFAFMASATTMLTYGVIDQKSADVKASPFYLGGLAQGFETLSAFVILCVMPFAFMPIAILLGCWCLIKALVIITRAYYKLNIAKKSKK